MWKGRTPVGGKGKAVHKARYVTQKQRQAGALHPRGGPGAAAPGAKTGQVVAYSGVRKLRFFLTHPRFWGKSAGVLLRF